MKLEKKENFIDLCNIFFDLIEKYIIENMLLCNILIKI